MAINLQRISLPCGPGSLSELVQSATHVLRIDRSGPAVLIDVSGKKPVAYELPILVIPSGNSNADSARVAISGGFAPDGQQLVLLRAGGTEDTASVELFDTQTREQRSSFEVVLTRRYAVSMMPDGERILVRGVPESLLCSREGKVLSRLATPKSFALSPSGEQLCLEDQDNQFVVRPLAGKTGKVKFEASSVT